MPPADETRVLPEEQSSPPADDEQHSNQRRHLTDLDNLTGELVIGWKEKPTNATQRVPANKKPPCIRTRSQLSYKTMNKTIGYRSKTIGCTQKSGFLFV